MDALFTTFDVDHSGKITAANIKAAFSKFGRTVTDEEVAEVLKQHDFDGCNGLNREEFKNMMLESVWDEIIIKIIIWMKYSYCNYYNYHSNIILLRQKLTI